MSTFAYPVSPPFKNIHTSATFTRVIVKTLQCNNILIQKQEEILLTTCSIHLIINSVFINIFQFY